LIFVFADHTLAVSMNYFDGSNLDAVLSSLRESPTGGMPMNEEEHKFAEEQNEAFGAMLEAIEALGEEDLQMDVRSTKKACNSPPWPFLAPIALLYQECYASPSPLLTLISALSLSLGNS
jgi:hypothetical protein